MIINKENISQYIGKSLEPSNWHDITQQQINQFADCTLDHQFIHVNPEAAKETPFGSTIAHGFLTLSMLSHFSESFAINIKGSYMNINAGFDKIRFIQPVKVNSRIRALSKVANIEEVKTGQFLLQMDITVEIENEEKPALVAKWNCMQMVK